MILSIYRKSMTADWKCDTTSRKFPIFHQLSISFLYSINSFETLVSNERCGDWFTSTRCTNWEEERAFRSSFDRLILYIGESVVEFLRVPNNKKEKRKNLGCSWCPSRVKWDVQYIEKRPIVLPTSSYIYYIARWIYATTLYIYL